MFSVLTHSRCRLLASCFCGALVGTVSTFTVLLKVLTAFLADSKGHRLKYGLQFRCFGQQSSSELSAQGAVGIADTKHIALTVQRQTAVFLVVVGTERSNQLDVFTSLLISLAVGILVSLIVTGKMKGKLKTVRMQPAAEEYVRKGSMLVTESSDLFLYSHVDRRAKSKDDDSGGGSSTHTSSSGSSHGGGGGKF